MFSLVSLRDFVRKIHSTVHQVLGFIKHSADANCHDVGSAAAFRQISGFRTVKKQKSLSDIKTGGCLIDPELTTELKSCTVL